MVEFAAVPLRLEILARIHPPGEFGGPEALKLEEVATPKPSAGEVLVRIHAAGSIAMTPPCAPAPAAKLKPPLPYTPGSDGAGVVEAVGEGAKKVKRGDGVYTVADPYRCICGMRAGAQ